MCILLAVVVIMIWNNLHHHWRIILCDDSEKLIDITYLCMLKRIGFLIAFFILGVLPFCIYSPCALPPPVACGSVCFLYFFPLFFILLCYLIMYWSSKHINKSSLDGPVFRSSISSVSSLWKCAVSCTGSCFHYEYYVKQVFQLHVFLHLCLVYFCHFKGDWVRFSLVLLYMFVVHGYKPRAPCIGAAVKAVSTLRAEKSGIVPCSAWFSHTVDLKVGTLVVTLWDAWHQAV